MSRTSRLTAAIAVLGAALLLVRGGGPIAAAGAVPALEQFIGFKVGADNKLARWDRIVEYMKLAATGSDRVRYRELGRTTEGNAMIALEIASADTIRNLDRVKQLQRRLYFQGGEPTPRERDEIFRAGKAVVLITCATHAIEIGCTQMALTLVHQLATEDSPAVRKILDNVVLLFVPSLNPDGQILVTDWFNQNLGTPFESSPLPGLYHPYVGHDSNRDMYMFTQKESQYVAELAWRDWFPAVWLDQHQMGAAGPRIFVMPATDPINPNVHPLIYRWNTILGQSQAAALEAAGKEGIIYNSTYTNYWQGAMAWSGWWHNQVGLLTEVASARIAAPVEQLRADAGSSTASGRGSKDGAESALLPSPLAAPTDTVARTEYPRPWMGGRWTLGDIVDYELISTLALLETAADRRETLLRQIYEVNRQTVEDGRNGAIKTIVVAPDRQHDPREARHLVERLMMGGVEVYRSDTAFAIDGRSYAAGTFVIPMTQVFARYAKDLLERQQYPDGQTANPAVETPYDVTAWSLGLLFGVNVDFIGGQVPTTRLARVTSAPRTSGRISGNGPRYTFRYRGPDTAIAINRLLRDDARVSFDGPGLVVVDGASRRQLEGLARELDVAFVSTEAPPAGADAPAAQPIRLPRIGLYYPWTGGNPDEGWTRWVLEQYEFAPVTIHNRDIREPELRRRFDVILLADQAPRELVDGNGASTVRPEYRGGIGEPGIENLTRFVAQGGTLITLGAASDFAVDRLSLPVRNLKRGLPRERHNAPGTILRIQVDPEHPLGSGMPADTYAFYTNGPFFSLLEGFGSVKPTVVARYPNQDIVASGWLRGDDVMAGRAAVVSVDMKPGRVVLFGLRPQHRGQTRATFPLLFNAIYLAGNAAAGSSN